MIANIEKVEAIINEVVNWFQVIFETNIQPKILLQVSKRLTVVVRVTPRSVLMRWLRSDVGSCVPGYQSGQ